MSLLHRFYVLLLFLPLLAVAFTIASVFVPNQTARLVLAFGVAYLCTVTVNGYLLVYRNRGSYFPPRRKPSATLALLYVGVGLFCAGAAGFAQSQIILIVPVILAVIAVLIGLHLERWANRLADERPFYRNGEPSTLAIPEAE